MPKAAKSAAGSASSSEDDEPARRRDKYEQLLYGEHLNIPEFASAYEEFAAMWDDGTYSDADKLSIYYAVLLQTLRKVNAISEQMEHGPILLEMALVKFLSVWLKWGTADRVPSDKFNRGAIPEESYGSYRHSDFREQCRFPAVDYGHRR